MEEYKLIKFFKGTATSQEEHEVNQWLKQPEARKEFESILEKHFENPSLDNSDDTDYDRMLQRIHRKLPKSKERKKSLVSLLFIRSFKIAASLILFIFCSYVLVTTFTDRKNKELTANGKQPTLTVRTTNPGEKLTIIMSDKSTIVVNANSKISFTSEYGKSERTINVEGEAFFDVAHNPSIPFKVVSEGITTTALGTEFLVYSRKDDHRIALVEGRVAINKAGHKVELVPGLMAIVDSKQGQVDFSVQPFDLINLTAWKEGKLIFDKKPLNDILKDLSTWYSVDFQIEEGLNTKRKVIGSFQNKNLKDILTGLSFSLDFEFEIKNNIVHLKKPAS